MKILKIDSYRDGGTVTIDTDLGHYCIDYRAMEDKNLTKGMLFLGYPGKSDPLPLTEAKQIKKQLKTALKEFGMQSVKYQDWLPEIERIKVK